MKPAAPARRPDPLVRVVYVVSRFPIVQETFIVRELDAVSAAGVEIELHSLFAPLGTSVQPAAEPWVARLRPGGARHGVIGLAWWLARRPVRLASSVAVVCACYRRRPALALRALATVAIACGHARALRTAPVDHVHAHFATYPALTAWLLNRLLGVPYSFTAHAHDLYVDQSMLTRKVNDACFVVTISEFNRRFLSEFGGGPGGTPVHVVRCGVDPQAYEFRSRAVPANGPVRALCVASLQEYKGHAVLLRALAARPELARLHVDLVGDGHLGAQLERLAEQLGLSGRVRFEGPRSEDEVRELLHSADLFVLPSVIAADGQMEGLPVALMEALACGVPVVTTRLSGIPELVVDGETGLLAEPGDAVGLADALARTLADPDAARYRCERGRARVVQGFDVRVSGRRMATLFRELN